MAKKEVMKIKLDDQNEDWLANSRKERAKNKGKDSDSAKKTEDKDKNKQKAKKAELIRLAASLEADDPNRQALLDHILSM